MIPQSWQRCLPAWQSRCLRGIRQRLSPRATLDPQRRTMTQQRIVARRYSTTKLANVYFTYGLAHRLPEGITANAFDPGLMPGTGLAREYPAVVRFAWHNILPRLIPLLRLLLVKNIHTPEESGKALARLIVDPALVSTNGKYFEGLREIPSSAESYDKDRAEELWRQSATLTGIERLP